MLACGQVAHRDGQSWGITGHFLILLNSGVALAFGLRIAAKLPCESLPQTCRLPLYSVRDCIESDFTDPVSLNATFSACWKWPGVFPTLLFSQYHPSQRPANLFYMRPDGAYEVDQDRQ